MITTLDNTNHTHADFKNGNPLTFVSCHVKPIINQSSDFKLYYEQFDESREIAIAFLFDKNQHSIGYAIAPYGSINHIEFPIRELVKISLITNTKSIILTHHHPSGNAIPSDCDINNTKKINNTLKNVTIDLYDHKIYSLTGFFSFKVDGLI